jgi:hypothetical protein
MIDSLLDRAQIWSFCVVGRRQPGVTRARQLGLIP